jgi:ribosome modulation factor
MEGKLKKTKTMNMPKRITRIQIGSTYNLHKPLASKGNQQNIRNRSGQGRGYLASAGESRDIRPRSSTDRRQSWVGVVANNREISNNSSKNKRRWWNSELLMAIGSWVGRTAMKSEARHQTSPLLLGAFCIENAPTLIVFDFYSVATGLTLVAIGSCWVAIVWSSYNWFVPSCNRADSF